MNNENKININYYPGHMAKTKREIKEKIDLIDIVFEVIDARIPTSSKNNDINSIIKDKPRLLIMTKVDLCDLEVSKKWQQHYEKMGYKVILTDLINNKNLNIILTETRKISENINKKREIKGLKPRRTRILILGIPNVGKSTLINRLVGKKVTVTGNKPGVTKNLEWIRINNELELLDTPGILWPKIENEEVGLNLASMTAIKEEVLNKEIVTFHIIKKMLTYYKEDFLKRYKLETATCSTTSEIVNVLDQIGKNIGAIKNNEVDYEKVYTIILRDLRSGYFGGVTFDRYEDR